MLSDYKPILRDFDPDIPNIELYFAHDIHKGDRQHDEKKWDKFKTDVLSESNRYVIFAGDYCDFATTGSRGNVYDANISLNDQKEWFTEQLVELKDRVIAIVPGNHENNRITKTVGLYPAYDCALLAGLGDLYRQHFAFVDLGVGRRKRDARQHVHYVGYITHRLRDTKAYNGSDFVGGIDFAAYGHDHDPHEHSRSRLVYDSNNKTISNRAVEVIDSGAFLTYGGYAPDHAYRPLSTKCYKLILFGGNKKTQTVGFYLD